jgi:uncharacterized repeat protein (TIGR01451 family)
MQKPEVVTQGSRVRRLEGRQAFGVRRDEGTARPRPSSRSVWGVVWLVLAISFAWADGAAGQVQQCATPPSGLVSWWPGDGNPNDIIGTNHGTLVNDTTFAAGKVGQAFSFDGNGDYVEMTGSNVGDFGSAPFTVDFWMYTANELAPSGFLVGKSNADGGLGWDIRWINDATIKVVGVNGWGDNITSDASATLNAWHHIALVSTDSLVTLYIDGAVKGTSPRSPISSTGNPFRMGYTTNYQSPAFNGLIDEVEIFNRALSAEEVAAIYNAGSAGKCRSCVAPPSGLVSWWGGDGNANDIIGTNHGTLVNGATYAAGKVGQAFSFSGVNDYVEIPDSSSLNPSGAFSVDGWFYIDPSASSNAGEIATLVAKTEGSTNNGWALYFDDRFSTKNLQFCLGNCFALQNAILTPNWYHIAGVFDPSATPTSKLYLNGAIVASANTGGATPNDLNVRIGAMYWTDLYHQGNDRLNGKADEVEFFNRALTAEEIAAIANAGSAGKCKCVAPPSDLVSWWGGDGNANDIIGTNHGTLVNDTTFAAGKVGQAFSFDGTDDYVDAGTDDVFNFSNGTGDFSIDAWIKLSAYPSQAAGIAGKATHGPGGPFNSPYTGWSILVQPSGALAFTGVGIWGFTTADGAVALGDWAHVAVTRNGSTYKLYVNGSESASVTHNGNLETSTTSLRIGTVYEDFSFFDGLIDELEIFNRALSAEEVAAIYNAGSAGKCRSCVTPPSNMVSWWKGENNADDSIDGNNGTLMNRATFAPGMVGQAFSFDGVDDYIEVPHSASLNLTGGLTLDTWFKLRSAGDGALFAKSDRNGDDRISSYILATNPDGSINVVLYGTYPADNWITAAGLVTTGQWYHVAATWDGTYGPSDNVKLYLNGALVQTWTKSLAPLNVNTLTLKLGSMTPPTRQMDGLIDEAEIFNRALSAEEIAAIANARDAGKCQGASPPTADLSVTKTDAPDPVTVGSNLTYTVTVTNNGPDAATGVTLTDALPAGVTFVSVTPVAPTCTQAGGVVACDLGTLASGANTTVTIVVTPTQAGEISNGVTVTGKESDPDTENNTATAGTTVNPPSCLGTGRHRLWGMVMARGSDPSGLTMTLAGPGGCTDTMTTTLDKWKKGKYGGEYDYPTLGRGRYTVTPSKPGCTFMPASRTVRISGDRVKKVDTFIGTCP